ncbi:MAG: isopentenyl phosphate kinase [Thermoplasmatota archaeon]
MIAVKLGGSVVTDKRRECCYRADVAQRLAHELAAADEPVMVVHGAGSYGHPQAERYGLQQGGGPDVLEGVAVTHAAVRDLNLRLLTAMHQAGIAAVSLPPFPSLDEGFTERMRQAVTAGLTPVTFGDVLIEPEVAIVSGDVLMQRLSAGLSAHRAIFVTNVDGILRNPKRPETVIARCTPDELSGAAFDDVDGADVTAGMAGKVKAIKEMAYSGIDVAVINGGKAGRLRQALQGDVHGTMVSIHE